MRFLIFADLHHRPDVFDGGTLEDLKTFQDAAVKNNCDFMIHAGDFCHGPSEYMDYVNTYNNSTLPAYHCLGGHDTDHTPLADALKAYNMPNDYYFFDNNGYRIIVTNPNYYKDGDDYINYELGNYYSHPTAGRAITPRIQSFDITLG